MNEELARKCLKIIEKVKEELETHNDNHAYITPQKVFDNIQFFIEEVIKTFPKPLTAWDDLLACLDPEETILAVNIGPHQKTGIPGLGLMAPEEAKGCMSYFRLVNCNFDFHPIKAWTEKYVYFLTWATDNSGDGPEIHRVERNPTITPAGMIA